MTENQSGEAATVDATASVVDTTVAERDYEAEAREQGWVPEDEFKGDKKPKKFLSAEDFVERGELVERAVKKTEAKFEDRFKKMERLNGKTVEQLQRQHEKDIADLKAAKTVAVKAGDVETVEKLDKQIDDLKEAGPEEKLSGKALEKHNETVQKDWMTTNSWFSDDFSMRKHAMDYSQFLAEKHPDITIEDNLAKVDAEMRKKYPEKFGGKPAGEKGANGHAPVDGGGSLGGGGQRSDPLSKLPAEARTQAKADMAKFPKIYPTPESWIKAYNT